ncbi:MAG: PAS domain S-box protein [Gemmataceae bacterium]|nr:PAS domain S-box protein [Gemmataceae bacterium]
MATRLRLVILEDREVDARPIIAALRQAGYDPDCRLADSAEEALRQYEELFRAAFDDTNVAMVLTDLDHRFVRANEAFAQMFGYSMSEVLTLTMADVTHPDDLAESYARREKLLSGAARSFQMEKRHLHKSGRVLWALTNVSLVRDRNGAPRLYFGQVQDITERKHAEETLHKTTEKLQSLVQASPLAIVALDRHNCVLSWNPAAEQMFGWPEYEVLGKPVPIIPADRADEFRRMIAEEWQGLTRANVELSRQRRDGALVDVSLWTAPVRDPRGQIVAILLLMADVTEHKRLGEQFRQAQKMEAIGRLAGGVAHDFNNLLTVILGCSEICLGKLRAGDPLRELVEQVHKAGERAALLTRQLLAFSRKQVLSPVVLDLSAQALDMEKMLRRLIGEDIELRISADANVWPVKADAGQLEQVVMNLVVNARDAMPRGGKLLIETANVHLDQEYVVRHAGVQPGPYVRLAITDTGSGMDAATQARLFEPFFSTKGARGTGLGLATVFGIVKQSGGFIEVYSEVGLGTTFKIYLPRDRSAPRSGKSHPGLGAPRQGTETILLVEDEDGVRGLASVALRNYGYKVLEAASGGEAFLLCERADEAIHLLVTDVVMPNMSGRQLAERLAALRPSMKVLYLSGYTDDAIVQHGVLDAGTPFLHKPFSPDALARKVREVLDEDAGLVSSNLDPGHL